MPNENAKPVTLCAHCGDPAGTSTVNRKPVCMDCYMELLTDFIPHPSKITAGRTGGRGSAEDDGNPWQQNAVRYLEDG